MTPKASGSAAAASLIEQTVGADDHIHMDAARALLKTGFLFTSQPRSVFEAFDLNLAQVDVLVALAGAPETTLTCSEIAEKTLITKGGITGVLDRLEARGLVKRTPCPEDRRSVLVRLTAKGSDFFRRFYPQVLHSRRSLFEKAFRPDQMREFTRLLGLLLRCLEEQ